VKSVLLLLLPAANASPSTGGCSGSPRYWPEAARPCRHAVGGRWHVDETYVKVAGRWRYVYRAIDQFGQVVEVFVSARRDAKAARRFFQRAVRNLGVSEAMLWSG
jgi:transposase-like protein